MHRQILALGLAAVTSLAGVLASAQHATAFDIEDGARMFASMCANCHGPDGNLIAGIDLGRGQFRRPLTDDELADIIENGIPNTAMPPSPGLQEHQVERIVAFLRENAGRKDNATVAGNPARGKALFEAKGECMDCHRIDGQGARVGPDLSNIGRLRRAVEIEQSLLEPQAEVQASNRFYRVVTNDGAEVKGRLLNHDTYTVQLLDLDERLRSFRKADLKEQRFDESPMPSYRRKLSSQKIADLVSYLVSRQAQ